MKTNGQLNRKVKATENFWNRPTPLAFSPISTPPLLP